MKPQTTADKRLALFFLAFAVVLVLVWVPLDAGTGLFEKVRRRFVIGDALGPTVAGVVIAIGAAIAWLRPSRSVTLSRNNVLWMLCLLGLFIFSLVTMRLAGPIAATWTESGYRPLRATAPWNYIGYLAGGTLLIGGLTGLASRRFAARDFVIGFGAALVIALLYDLPFDGLILPPNGDV